MTDLWNIQRFIFECDPSRFGTALRAAQWIIDRPQQRDAIVAYGEGHSEVSFYVKRNKSSISIRQNNKP